MFWDVFYDLCKKHNTTPNAVCKEINLSNATATYWKNGTLPKSEALIALSDFFDVSVDYLLGRSQPIHYGNVTGNNSGNAGNTNCSFGASADCSEEAKEIDQMLKSLSFKDRAQLMNIIVEFVETHNK